jgi:hypothetical protein
MSFKKVIVFALLALAACQDELRFLQNGNGGSNNGQGSGSGTKFMVFRTKNCSAVADCAGLNPVATQCLHLKGEGWCLHKDATLASNLFDL